MSKADDLLRNNTKRELSTIKERYQFLLGWQGGAMSNTKYKMFRNYMANELGITKDDIKEWTREAIAEQAAKTMGQINIPLIVEHEVHRALSSIRSELVLELLKKVEIRTKP